MVRRAGIALLMSLATTPACAEAGWTQAGGALFVGDASENASADGPAVRVHEPRQPFADAVSMAAARHGLDPKLLHALVAVESAYRPAAVSPAGAAGLAQLMPATAKKLGVHDRFDPQANLLGGAEYLARQLLRFGDLRLALAAFNAGPARVQRLGRVPDIPETRAYVEAVIECYLALSAGRTVTSARQCKAGRAS